MLADIIPAKHRRRVYALVTLAAAVFGAWQASNGDWTTFAASVLTALTTGMATANTVPPTTRGEDGTVVPLFVWFLAALVLLVALFSLVGHPVSVG